MFPHPIKHHLNNSSQQEDDENYCNKDDNEYDRFPDGLEPSWCSDLNDGCKSFIVCDEDGRKYEKASFLKQQDIGDTSSEESNEN